MTTIVSATYVTNLSLLTLVFSAAVTWNGNEGIEPNALIFDHDGGLWATGSVSAQPNATTIVMDFSNSVSGDEVSSFALLGPFASVTTQTQLQTASPQYAV